MKTYQEIVFFQGESAAYDYLGGGEGRIRNYMILAEIYDVDENKVYKDIEDMVGKVMTALANKQKPTVELAKDIVME